MGDYHGIIPLPDKAKIGVDLTVMPTAVWVWLSSIEMATWGGLLAIVYTLIRIIETQTVQTLWRRLRRK